jgi:hypothetical protein
MADVEKELLHFRSASIQVNRRARVIGVAADLNCCHPQHRRLRLRTPSRFSGCVRTERRPNSTRTANSRFAALGWLSPARIWVSRVKRARRSGSAAKDAGSTLMATSRYYLQPSLHFRLNQHSEQEDPPGAGVAAFKARSGNTAMAISESPSGLRVAINLRLPGAANLVRAPRSRPPYITALCRALLSQNETSWPASATKTPRILVEPSRLGKLQGNSLPTG